MSGYSKRFLNTNIAVFYLSCSANEDNNFELLSAPRHTNLSKLQFL
jgi:hypothetical protein